MKALNDFKLIIEHAERGIAVETAEKRLKAYRVRRGDMFENRDTGKQFVVYGISTCNRLMGIGLNYDHSGYVYKENCKRISYKDIRPFKAKDEVPTKEDDPIQEESTLPDKTSERSTWLSSAEASKYINRERTVIAKLAKNRKVKFTRAPNTKKLMFHRRWLDSYLMGYGVEPTAEEEAILDSLNRY